MGWKLVKHAVLMVTGNLTHALKASAVPFLLVLLVGFAFPVPVMEVPDGGVATPDQIDTFLMLNSGRIALASFVTAIVSAFVFSWVAVTWHRFILLEEYPGPVPAVADRPIFSYIWRSFLAGILVGLAAVPLMLVALPVLGMIGGAQSIGSASSASALLVFLVLGAVLSFVWFRIAIVLPGTAIGKPMTFREGWSATAALAGPIFAAGVIIVGANLVIGAVLSVLLSSGSALELILNIIVQWFTLMVGASMLTTLYGHLVEGRDLV